MSNNNMPMEEDSRWAEDHFNNVSELESQLHASREEIDQLKSEVKKKKNRIGILNRSLRRLKKDK